MTMPSEDDDVIESENVEPTYEQQELPSEYLPLPKV